MTPETFQRQMVDVVLRRVLNIVKVNEEFLNVVGTIRELALLDTDDCEPHRRAAYLHDTDLYLRWILDESLFQDLEPIKKKTPEEQ